MPMYRALFIGKEKDYGVSQTVRALGPIKSSVLILRDFSPSDIQLSIRIHSGTKEAFLYRMRQIALFQDVMKKIRSKVVQQLLLLALEQKQSRAVCIYPLPKA